MSQAPGCPFPHAAAGAASAQLDPRGCPVSAAAAAFDPFEDGYQQSPPDELRWARAQEPIFYAPKLGYWVVARYDDVKAVFRDHLTFSPSIALEKITPTGEAANAVLAQYGYAMNRTLVNEDEPAHMARRRLLMEPFTPAALAHHEPLLRQLTREYVDRFIDSGRADLVDQMLWEVPLTMALHFLGVPEEDMPKLRQYSIAHTVNTWGRPSAEQQVAVAHAVGNFWQLAGEILAKMRLNPDAPGWMPFGIRMQREHPEVVTDSYLHSMMMAGIVAAHETTANATANAVKLLLQNRPAWDELCADPRLIPNAVEECLRHNGSVAAWRRLVTQDTEVGGVKLAAGSKLLIVMASANHDEAHFPDADAVDLRRDNAVEHLTFGYGAHQCMGKNLARLELQVFLDEFTRRLPHMRLAEQRFSYLPNTSFRGPEHLWVEWDPAQNPERRDPRVRDPRHAVRIGEPARNGLARPVVVQAAEAVADGVLRLTLAAPDGQPLPRWRPGAHIDIECGDAATDSDAPVRAYSLCSDPADLSHYQVAVLRDPASRGGSAWVHANAKPGATLRIRGPRNHFHFEPEPGARVLLIAGGIGITPIAAMAREAQARGLDYTLHYSGRNRSALALLPELQALHGQRLVLHVADEGTRADLAAITSPERAGGAQGATQVWACGPERLLAALQALADDPAAPWPDDALHIEHFTAHPATLDATKEVPFEVELKVSGLTLTVPADRTLLSVLRGANMDIPSDCEEGLCGSCEVRVLAGEVDHRDRVLTRAERSANTKILSCCSRAVCGRAGGQRLVLDL
ncbi:cytochrome P450/oxidoreductase [Ideonella sp. DXS22W]|uniref:Cytochrome P450/oxidoreductase n=1 Tax=Pseudaquabacterium inlustre TaxID=2984192 RepID=A0ABU9CGN3_9BURK